MRTPVCRPPWVVAALMLMVPFGPALAQSTSIDRVRLPGSGYEVVLGSSATAGEPGPALVDAIGAWLSQGFGLPKASEPPSFRFVSTEAMIALRERGVASDHRSETTIGGASTAASQQPDIVALYDDELRTIYLHSDWRGHTAGELSIVVHEMVHHIQNTAHLKYECGEAREKLAFEAQEQWLGLFGQDLETQFGLDPFTLLVRTNCGF
jgi:hypothetical protein